MRNGSPLLAVFLVFLVIDLDVHPALLTFYSCRRRLSAFPLNLCSRHKDLSIAILLLSSEFKASL